MTVPTITPPAPGFTIDKRQAFGIGIGLFCIGILVGFKLAGGEPMVIDRPVFVDKHVPCADCEEQRIQEARAMAAEQRLIDQSEGADNSGGVPD